MPTHQMKLKKNALTNIPVSPFVVYFWGDICAWIKSSALLRRRVDLNGPPNR